jgi:hypothetical protein
VPLQLPGLADSVCPTTAVPEILGGVVSEGGVVPEGEDDPEDTVAVAAETAELLPTPFVAVTVTWIVAPTLPELSMYD